jgi:pimeloyl-ACP methyl ester carboxylesterase
LQPTLVVAGDDDPITPLINHRVMARMIPRARLHIVRGGGHLALLDSPDLVAPEIVAFLRAGDD